MKKIKSVAVIGAGCIGMMYGQIMAEALGSGRVFLIADADRIARYEETDIYVNDRRCAFDFSDPARPDRQADLILFCVKFMALDEAVAAARGFMGPDTILLSALNGIASEEVIADALGSQHLLYCLVYGMDATREGRRVHYDSSGTVAFGDTENRRTDDVEAVARLLGEAGIRYEIPADIHHLQWSKLMLNVGLNQACAVFKTDYGGAQRPGETREAMLAAMQETRKVAAGEGVTLTQADVDGWMQVLAALNPSGMPSMRQDLLAGRKTEVALFSGTIRMLGKKHGVPTPVNNLFYEKIQEMERTATPPRG